MQGKSMDELRDILGTNPHDGSGLGRTIVGVRDIEVRLVQSTYNPYEAMVTMATATWGPVDQMDKWSMLSPEGRFEVTKAVLQRKALPLALEAPQFTFEISGCSRAAFDQIARARIGATFASMGWRDNNHSDISFRMPNAIYDAGVDARIRWKLTVDEARANYQSFVRHGQADWQAARSLLPISACHRFVMTINYMALLNLCAKRLMFCEQEDTVAVAWLLRERVLEKFPLLGTYLRPSCDWVRRCTYHNGQELSEAFGCLFRGCGRWPESNDEYGIFNSSSSNPDIIANQLEISIPDGDVDKPKDRMTYEELDEIDQALFTSI